MRMDTNEHFGIAEYALLRDFREMSHRTQERD